MASVYSVSQVNAYIKNMFAQDFALNRISIKGEVSNCKYHTSGHIYFTLKDRGAAIACVMFAGQRKGLSFKLEEGQKAVSRSMSGMAVISCMLRRSRKKASVIYSNGSRS